jgi:PD-(D/E)XK nuclease superfamily protein
MPTLEDFFKSIDTELKKVREDKRLADLCNSPAFSVFDYIEPDENCLSDILADLLDPQGPHGQGTLFLEEFLQMAGLNLKPTPENTKVRREDTTTFLAKSRRIDFTVEVGLFGVGVENKPWASDLEEQVASYIEHLAKNYEAKGYCMIYLSGDGHPLQSLDEKTQCRLKEEGRFRVVPYTAEPSLREWLKTCLARCHSARVCVFLDDFTSFIDDRFGMSSQDNKRKNMETDVVVNHAMSGNANMALFLEVVKAFNAVANRIISEFTKELAGRLESELGKLGGGWWVKNDSSGGEGEELGEAVAIGKKDWPGGPAWKDSLRVVLAYDHPKPCAVYFSARRQPRLVCDAEADRIAEELSKQCGPGRRDGAWWPYWYRYEKMKTSWSDPDVLLELGQKDLLDHFVCRMRRMAKAVDSAFSTLSSD